MQLVLLVAQDDIQGEEERGPDLVGVGRHPHDPAEELIGLDRVHFWGERFGGDIYILKFR